MGLHPHAVLTTSLLWASYPTFSPLNFLTCKAGIKIFSLKLSTIAASYIVARVTVISQWDFAKAPE